MKTICVDFDGVLHSYTSGWQGAGTIADPPVPGAIEWLITMAPHYDIAIYSSRSKNLFGLLAMRKWIIEQLWNYFADETLKQMGLSALKEAPNEAVSVFDGAVNDAIDGVIKNVRFPLFKPAAWLTIDDRAICFDGQFPGADEIDGFRPWYKRP